MSSVPPLDELEVKARVDDPDALFMAVEWIYNLRLAGAVPKLIRQFDLA